MSIHFVVPCLFGLEEPIARELETFGAGSVRAENGSVRFTGDESILARVNINSRYSERVLVELGRFEALSFDGLFEGTKALPWEDWIGPRDTFPVKGYTKNSALFSVSDCQSIIKKAVVERLKLKYGIEWFEETGPVHQIQFSLLKDTASLLLDTTGPGLHKRGYRLDANEAPIKETLAASLCYFSRLMPYHTLYDPMCGSGTILIEGAMLAANMAPGLNRNFSAERWGRLPETVWKEERERAKSLALPLENFFAYGSDIDSKSIENAKTNAQRAGFSEKISFKAAPLNHFKPDSEKGTLVCNPPYGERMLDAEEAAVIHSEMGRVFERKRGWSYSIISPSETFEQEYGRKADKRRKLYNGMIKCQLYMYFK